MVTFFKNKNKKLYLYLVGILSFSFLSFFFFKLNFTTEKLCKGKGCLTDKGYQG